MLDWIELTRDPLHLPTGIEFIYAAEDNWLGGINVFVGLTRREKNAAGQDLTALDYEAYEEMALEQMRALARRAAEQWPISRLLLLHRLGRVAVGEPSVVIAVATPHRAEAFEACRWLIDTLKAEVPIWKQEVWSGGSTSWVEGHVVKP
jgi:molybdopterin synthase catalytic subunit